MNTSTHKQDLQAPQIPVSVLVQTKNEAVGIRKCLEALHDFSEVIVVDSNSTDSTIAIAKELGARVERFTWNGKYPKKKQWQIENVQTKHDWILFIDADETPTSHLIEELRTTPVLRRKTKTAAIDLQLIYVFDGGALKHGHRVQKRALLDKRRASFPVIDDLDAPGMGELEGHYQPTVQGHIGYIANAIRHDDQDPVRTWFDRHNRYSDWEAHLRLNQRTRRSVGQSRNPHGRLFDRAPGKPILFFLYAYIIKRGLLDGRPGLNYAIALSFYYWQIALKVREQRRTSSVISHGVA